MSRIIFNKISFKNFQSFGNNLTEVDLDKEKISLICGTNGSGKTCVIQTISYALFGKSLTGITKGDLINNKNKRNLWTELIFTIGNDTYKLTRGEKPSILELTKNGEEVPVDGDSRVFQKKLEAEILRFDFKAFKQLVCLGSEFTRFFKMTAAERRVFIEGILDLQVISEMQGFAKEDLKSTKKKLEEFDIEYQQKSSNLKIYEEEQAKENQNIVEQKDKLLDEKTTLEAEITEHRKELNDVAQQIKHFGDKEDEAKAEYNKYSTELTKLKSNWVLYKEKWESLKKELAFYEEHTVCPTCKQKLGEEFIKSKKNELTKAIEDEAANLAQIKTIAAETKEKAELYEDLMHKANNAKLEPISKKSKLTTLIETKTNRISTISTELQTLDSVKPGGTREVVIKGLKDELEELSTKKRNYTARIDVYNIIIQALSDTGVKQAIISNYIDYINQQLAVYLERFNFNFSIEFDSEFNDTILMDFRDQVQYESLSEGQKARLEFCILMVWRDIARTRNSVSTNLLSIDELFDSALDDSGMQDMIDVLKGEQGNIFVISHKNVKSMFEHIYEITKEKYGFSELKEL